MNSMALELLGAQLMLAGMDQLKLDRLSRLERYRITPDTELPPMQFLFRLFGKPCFPRGELVALTGKPKTGKTFVASMLMALCFTPEVLFFQREDARPLRALWYDTEQSDVSTQDILKNRILPMSGQEEFSPDEFQVFNVRREPWRERMALLETAMGEFRPDLVVLDGVRDLVNDINDGVLAQEVMEKLMLLADVHNCCLVCVLHQNKSGEDKNLRGWIGTELTHKAFEVYECRKELDGSFSVSQLLTRKYDIRDTLRYVVDECGIPLLVPAEEMPKGKQKPYHNEETSRQPLNPKFLLGWEKRMPVMDLEKLFAESLPEVGMRYAAEKVQEQTMKLAGMTSQKMFFCQLHKAQSMNVLAETKDEFGRRVYYRPAASVPLALPPVPGDEDPQFDFSDSPPGEVPF